MPEPTCFLFPNLCLHDELGERTSSLTISETRSCMSLRSDTRSPSRTLLTVELVPQQNLERGDPALAPPAGDELLRHRGAQHGGQPVEFAENTPEEGVWLYRRVPERAFLRSRVLARLPALKARSSVDERT